ncbi:Xaa-Pro peptidase family protein [Tropicimonas sp. IMCC34011]|uniref:M24 family metallopeptidase n=1 Tax=Tropicimonas sp. IMCC34011 TaxID=2248759 RepID=UPI0018E59E80|nr:Xaa-Pro peptidase family protein [Tropicimonas sp. IMCC34011]
MQPINTSPASGGRQANGHRADQLNRVAELAEVLRSRNIDAAIIDAAEHMRYLFGYSASAVMYQCCIVTANGSAHAIVRELDEALFASASWVTERAAYVDWEDPFDLLISEIQRLGLAKARIAQELDSNYLTTRDQRRLAAALPDVKFTDISGVILRMRARKSPAEIEEHRRAAAIADLGVSAVLDAMAEGVSEGELVAAGYSAALAAGADNNAPRLVLLGMGATTQHMHGGVGDRRLEVGQPVHIELLPQSNGYSTRIMRPAVLGTPPSQLHADVEQLIEIQDRQFAAMRPGVPAKEIDRLAREDLARSGLRDHFPHNTGYGIGIITGPKLADFAHLFTPASEWELQQGMVFHMYLSAAGIQISETICVTDDGIERLTRAPRKLLTKTNA